MKGAVPSIKGHTADPMSACESEPMLLDCQTVFQRISKDCVRLIQNSRKLAAAADPDAIHSMRIELTRLRAAILFFSPMTHDAAWPEIRKELRWLNLALGKARDCDVTANYARRKRYRFWSRSRRRALLRARDKGHRNLARKLSSARYDSLIRALKDWITRGAWLPDGRPVRSEPANIYSQARLRDWRNRICREGQHLRVLSRQRLHRLRIRCKRYRYALAALQLFGVATTRQNLEFSELAAQVHRVLGDLRDLQRFRNAAHDPPPGYRKSKRRLLREAEKPFRLRPAQS
jgi:CHAD domain-containing protein